MSTVPPPPRTRAIKYPTSDGKPMAETDIHRDLLSSLIYRLEACYADDPMVYVSGNLLLFYEEGNNRRHVAPDVFVVRGVAERMRDNFLLWEEGLGPNFVVELTSSKTRREDTDKKFLLYRDVLKVREYFLFDPNGDYLKPSLQGWRRIKGVYKAIRGVEGRLPSLTTRLHLEGRGTELRLWNPETNTWLITHRERIEQSEERTERAKERIEQAEAKLRHLRERFGLPDTPPSP